MSDFLDLTLADARDGLCRRDFTARELTGAYLDAMTAARVLNAYCAETPEQALEMAAAADQALAAGNAGPLAGIPLGIKDLFCTKEVLAQASSRILDGFRPRYESTVTANLWRDGAVMLGKTAMDEFAMGSSTETAVTGPVINPWRGEGYNKNLVPGGYSGGS